MSFARSLGTKFSTMASQASTAAPFTRAVVNTMRKLYPEELADKSFDNTGLLLEAPFDPQRRQKNSVLLTVDLTKAVADEAIKRRDSIIVAYHPIIFRGLKSLTLQNSQQQSLLRLAAAGISVYSPHTAVDCALGGLGDWLADIVTGTPIDAPGGQIVGPKQSSPSAPSAQSPQERGRPVYMLQHHPSQQLHNHQALALGQQPHTRTTILPTTIPNHPETGMGRIVHLSSPVPLTEIIDRIGLGLGNPKAFPIAIPQGKEASEMMISSIGICAGSGGHLFGELDKRGEIVDLLFTGEFSHHEALAAIERGQCVVTLFHSNTERGFLHGVLKGQLEKAVGEEWERIWNEEGAKQGRGKEHRGKRALNAFEDDSVEVHVSEVDRDPYGIMIAKSVA